jgi:diguanylate cyclase (GGDEF)-like protein
MPAPPPFVDSAQQPEPSWCWPPTPVFGELAPRRQLGDPVDWPAMVDALSEALNEARRSLAEVQAELAGTLDGARHARHQALHDGLTSLPNRGHFREQLAHTLSQSSPPTAHLAVLVLDLDGFKHVNDTHGHAAGDELLCIIAARLHRAVRAEDMVSRLGGDEFACLLSGVPNQAQLRRLACKLFDAIAAPVRIGDIRLAVRPSIGIARYPLDGDTPEALLKHADLAMYQAKRAQTGYAFCELGEA